MGGTDVDREQFDRLSRLVAAAGTRRDMLRIVIGGAVAGAAASADESVAKQKKRSRRGNRGKVRAQQEEPLCPNTCNRNCSSKPIHGGVDLSRCNLSGRDLDGANLSGSNVSRACFEDASLRNVSFAGANVSRTCFCNADLRGADFRGTAITTAQLSCAKPGCDTILPNGQRAIRCGSGETCCDGICVRTGSDPENCGACGVECGVCQRCTNGQCVDLPDGQFDCNGQPLVPFDPNLFCRAGLCTATTSTGICDGGICNCGPLGSYDAEANRCGCDQEGQDTCDEFEPGGCCEINETCLANGEYCNGLNCLEPPCG
jgi:hypothetical protein